MNIHKGNGLARHLKFCVYQVKLLLQATYYKSINKDADQTSKMRLLFCAFIFRIP